jgi:hypothetical protein
LSATPQGEAGLAPSAVAQVLGFDIRSDDPVPDLVGALRDRRLVLVLDNCEHVIEAAATLAVAILRGAADVHILATSREPLRVEGEYVQRLPPLSSGFPSDHLGAAEALAFPAVNRAPLNTEFACDLANSPFLVTIRIRGRNLRRLLLFLRKTDPTSNLLPRLLHEDMADKVVFVQPLHDDDNRAPALVVEPAVERVVIPLVASLPLSLGERLLGLQRIVQRLVFFCFRRGPLL